MAIDPGLSGSGTFLKCFDLALQGSGYCRSLKRGPEHKADQACRLGKLRIRFERRLEIHKTLLEAVGCCNLLRTPGSSSALEAPLSDLLRPFLGRFQGAKLFERCRAVGSIHSVCHIPFASIGSLPAKMVL
jgi:hypothetical protein